jgi:hypothetical protein
MISTERRTAEGCLRLDVRAPVVRAGVSHAGTGVWTWPLPGGEQAVVAYAVRGDALAMLLPGDGERGQVVRLERARCRFGGARRWFRCGCGRRAAVLFLPPDKLASSLFRCRSCARVVYRSTRLGHADRLDLRRDRLLARFGFPPGPGVPPKPPGMRWRTYMRLSATVEQLEERALVAGARRLGFR